MRVSKANALKRWKGSQRRIGITGGIASGKTSIGKYIESVKNTPILDADMFSREALTANQTIKDTIINRYGRTIVDKENTNSKTINRAALGEIIFHDKNERIWLENLLHPIIEKRFEEELEKHKLSSTIVLIIPLLFEANFTYLCSEVWLIYCSLDEQYERLMKRDGLNKEQAKYRIEAQLPLESKKILSDHIIDNTNKLDLSYPQVEVLL
ncbi:Dephospho-CoA kinase [Prochlorococcus marinus subsp. marinus str. CCMP1375]|uniref:Dephospho-CoA kinase n=1 Tax=Prochlorococcus marinus (strain SARG / CCMP1375 / SS120) TaxID=167539 RepID=COAE_PROMA|nr:dephospho-CoA kinase [Prochlorococcus marinus]Q7VEG0.1 RecName: Full=Dephospho-CoA kinase; AltName: Full=Dephosphocoenzyme A kinase [Prochlorococcus marinus subsp. marinus str. CCMP1375]AAP99099.1 Dephospho-CoA kinase [Prochlorococcus marinus subsp. marinus str. CCMP1375]